MTHNGINLMTCSNSFETKFNPMYFQLARFPGGSHNETWTIPNYYQTINYFLDEVIT